MSTKGFCTSINRYVTWYLYDIKKELANEIVKHSNVNEITYSDKDISTLAETFNITIDEARNALTEAGNDLKTAIKNLRLKSL